MLSPSSTRPMPYGRTQRTVARVALTGSAPTYYTLNPCQALHVAVTFPLSAPVYLPQHGVLFFWIS